MQYSWRVEAVLFCGRYPQPTENLIPAVICRGSRSEPNSKKGSCTSGLGLSEELAIAIAFCGLCASICLRHRIGWKVFVLTGSDPDKAIRPPEQQRQLW